MSQPTTWGSIIPMETPVEIEVGLAKQLSIDYMSMYPNILLLKENLHRRYKQKMVAMKDKRR